MSVRDLIALVTSVPVFVRTDASRWVRILEHVFEMDDGKAYLDKFDNLVGLGHFEDRQ